MNQLVPSCFCTMSWLTCAILHVIKFPNNSNVFLNSFMFHALLSYFCLLVAQQPQQHNMRFVRLSFCKVLHSTFFIIFSLHFMSHHVRYFHQWGYVWGGGGVNGLCRAMPCRAVPGGGGGRGSGGIKGVVPRKT